MQDTERAPQIRVQRPAPEAQRPVLVSSPHSGTGIPDEERQWYAIDVDRLLFDGDLYVHELYDGVVGCGASFITTPWSRFVIDLNRLPDDVSPRSVQGGAIKRAAGYYGDRGLLWAITTHNALIYKTPLPRPVYENRLESYYFPYHEAVRAELERLRGIFGYAILLDAHSMPSRATRLHSDTGSARADIVPGDLRGRACGRWLTEAVEDFWGEAGYSVATNKPYQGGGITRTYGDPQRGIHAIQVELNRKLYMNEETLERNEGFSELANDCRGFVRHICGLSRPNDSP